MLQLPWTTTSQGLHRHYWWGCLIFPTATAFLNAVSEVTSHTWPPEAFLHKSYGATLTLMSCLSVATIEGSAPMPLRNYELEHNLTGLSLSGLPVQEAVLDEQVPLCLNIGSHSLFVQHLMEGHLKCFTWCPQVLGNLIEDWVLLLLLLPVSDISCGQLHRSSHYRLFLDCLLAIWNGLDSLFCTLFKWHDSIVEYGLDPRVWNLVQVLPNFLLREAFIHLAQEVGHSVVLTLLVLQGEL